MVLPFKFYYLITMCLCTSPNLSSILFFRLWQTLWSISLITSRILRALLRKGAIKIKDFSSFNYPFTSRNLCISRPGSYSYEVDNFSGKQGVVLSTTDIYLFHFFLKLLNTASSNWAVNSPLKSPISLNSSIF